MFLISMLWGVSKEGELSPGGVSNTVGSFKCTASDKLFFPIGVKAMLCFLNRKHRLLLWEPWLLGWFPVSQPPCCAAGPADTHLQNQPTCSHFSSARKTKELEDWGPWLLNAEPSPVLSPGHGCFYSVPASYATLVSALETV